MSESAIVWFRRDFRLADHPALDRACGEYARIIPVYIHDPEAQAPWQPGAASRWWLHHALEPSGALPGGQGALSLVRQLAWREFSATLLYHSL